jgi:hypothetical protein
VAQGEDLAGLPSRATAKLTGGSLPIFLCTGSKKGEVYLCFWMAQTLPCVKNDECDAKGVITRRGRNQRPVVIDNPRPPRSRFPPSDGASVQVK